MGDRGRVTGKSFRTLVLVALTSFGVLAWATGTPQHPGDPHYTPGGFFDVHICHWPGQPPFFLTLFSTTHFNDVKSVEVVRPNGKVLGKLNLARYRLIKASKGQPEKHVFITHFAIPKGARSGWYTGHVTMRDGRKYVGRDYVIRAVMPRAYGLIPKPGSENIALPHELRWHPVPGAAYYEVFVRDLWQAKMIYDSPLVRKPEVVLPKGLIKPGGYYQWWVHARDVNGHVLLGDFNDGSLSDKATFTVSDKDK